ncbi:MAG: sigma-70 family RNA polymerase sigma factor [Pirellulaceae bacterium]|nr:sigma-70 family RNA polymerase sigma factor [Pirellulaceae bacterium]
MQPVQPPQPPLLAPARSDLAPARSDVELGRYRDWLRSCVEQISSRYQAKFDQSDIVQETLAEAYAHLGAYRGTSEAELTSWLKRMLSRNLVDAVRKLRCRKRDVAHELRLNQSGYSGQRSGARRTVQLRAEQTSPSGRVAKHEELQQMQAAIAALPDAQREAVTLHHLQGLTLAEVAVRMNRSMPAIAGLLHRGLRALQESVGK